MANNRLRFEGLEELRSSLRRLPVDLRDDAELIVYDSANLAADDIRAGYAPHRITGDLADGVVVEKQFGSGKGFAGSIVRNKSKLAFIFENGTVVRHSAFGNRGAMPPGHVFVPAVIKRRKEMYERIRAMMRGHGLKVTG